MKILLAIAIMHGYVCGKIHYCVSDYYLEMLGAWEETNPFYEIDYFKNEVRMYSYSS